MSQIKARLTKLEQSLVKRPAKRKTLDDFYNETHLLDAFYPEGGKALEQRKPEGNT